MEFLRAIAHNIRVQGHAIWLCARDPELGWPLRIFALAIAAYALSPIDLIPDFIPVLGMLDDAILLRSRYGFSARQCPMPFSNVTCVWPKPQPRAPSAGVVQSR